MVWFNLVKRNVTAEQSEESAKNFHRASGLIQNRKILAVLRTGSKRRPRWILIRVLTMASEKYHKYLAGRKWALKKKAVKERCKGVCERCEKRPMDCVHHLTYKRIYNEPLTDLQGLCFPCHAYVSAEINEDPCFDDSIEEREMVPSPHDLCTLCGKPGDLIGHTDDKWYCVPCSLALDEARHAKEIA